MAEEKKKYHHWSYLIMGVLLVVAGLYAIVSPIADLFVIAILFIASGFALGIGSIIQYVQSKEDRSAWYLVIGILNIIFSIILLVFIGTTTAIVPFVVAIYLLVYAILLIVLSVKMKDLYKTWWLMLVIGILSALLAVGMIIFDQLGVTVVAIFVSVYLLASGITAIISFFTNTKKGQGFFSEGDDSDLVE